MLYIHWQVDFASEGLGALKESLRLVLQILMRLQTVSRFFETF